MFLSPRRPKGPAPTTTKTNLGPAFGPSRYIAFSPPLVSSYVASSPQAKITRTWISYNTPETPTPSHAGVLLALGLAGHLRILAATDIYRYLAQEHDVTTVGVLLGMAAAHRGTLNPVISKMLYLHIPARHPPSFPELELPPLVQSAALMAVGLLYQGSAHRLTTEILLAGQGRSLWERKSATASKRM